MIKKILKKIVAHDYKFIADNSDGNFPEMDYELYNMDVDKWEMKNLAYNSDYEAIVNDFKKAILDHYSRQKGYLPQEKPPIVPRSLWDIKFPFQPWEKTGSR